MLRSLFVNPVAGSVEVEALEGRRLLSHGTPVLHPAKDAHATHPVPKVHAAKGTIASMNAGGAIRVAGTPKDDIIDIHIDSAEASKLDIVVNGKTTQFPFNTVRSISIDGGGGNDLIQVNQLNGNINIPVAMIGGAGNDTLVGGSGNDNINGGAGNDVIVGMAGDDTLLGGPGNDKILRGDGNNTVDGGPGTNTIPADGGMESHVTSPATPIPAVSAPATTPPISKPPKDPPSVSTDPKAADRKDDDDKHDD